MDGALLKHCSAQIIKHAQFNFLLVPFWVSFIVCVCVSNVCLSSRDAGIRYIVFVCWCVCVPISLQHRCGFQGCLSAESLDDLIWVDQMNHTFNSAVTNTSDRDPTTQNPASHSNFYNPPSPPPPPNHDLPIIAQLRTNESIDLRHERLKSQVKHLSL